MPILEWEPGCWCAATLKLCTQFSVDDGDSILRYPEQWVYFLWRPAAHAQPYMRPDCYGLTLGASADKIAEGTEAAPVYLLHDHECDWASLLEIVLVCSDLEPWLHNIITGWQQRKQREMRERFVSLYGSESADFQRFLAKLVSVHE